MSGWIASRIGWMTNADYLAASAHVGWALAIVLLAQVIFRTPLAIGITFGVGMIAAGVKEFWFDATYEVPKQTFRDNLTDFLTYLGGGLLGLLVSLLTL